MFLLINFYSYWSCSFHSLSTIPST